MALHITKADGRIPAYLDSLAVMVQTNNRDPLIRCIWIRSDSEVCYKRSRHLMEYTLVRMVAKKFPEAEALKVALKEQVAMSVPSDLQWCCHCKSSFE